VRLRGATRGADNLVDEAAAPVIVARARETDNIIIRIPPALPSPPPPSLASRVKFCRPALIASCRISRLKKRKEARRKLLQYRRDKNVPRRFASGVPARNLVFRISSTAESPIVGANLYANLAGKEEREGGDISAEYISLRKNIARIRIECKVKANAETRVERAKFA